MKFVAGVLAAVAGVGAMIGGIVLVGGDAGGFVGAEGIHLHARSWLAGVGIPVALLVYYGILALERRSHPPAQRQPTPESQPPDYGPGHHRETGFPDR